MNTFMRNLIDIVTEPEIHTELFEAEQRDDESLAPGVAPGHGKYGRAGKLGFSRSFYLHRVFNSPGKGEESWGEVVDVMMGAHAYLEVTVRMRESGEIKVFRFAYVDEKK